MLIGNPTQNLEVQRRQALARVYALLIRLAEEKESVNVQAVDSETKDPKEVTREKGKDNKRASRNQRK